MDVRTEKPVTHEELEKMYKGEQALPMERHWQPITGGILAIIAGYLNILAGALLISGITFSGVLGLVTTGVLVGGGVLAFLGIVSVIGGFFAVARKAWPMALIGSITALVPSISLIPGVLSLIFVSISRPDFKNR